MTGRRTVVVGCALVAVVGRCQLRPAEVLSKINPLPNFDLTIHAGKIRSCRRLNRCPARCSMGIRAMGKGSRTVRRHWYDVICRPAG